MTAEDMTMQALRKEVSELTLRLKELGEENRDLREICTENGHPRDGTWLHAGWAVQPINWSLRATAFGWYLGVTSASRE